MGCTFFCCDNEGKGEEMENNLLRLKGIQFFADDETDEGYDGKKGQIQDALLGNRY